MIALWMQDLRYTFRQLRHAMSFTAAVVLTLALGIGLNAAIFAIVDCVLLRPLGYHDASRIYGLDTRFLEEGRAIPRLGGDDYFDVADKVRSFESTAYYSAGMDGVSIDGRSLYLEMAGVSPRFGSVMGVEPVAGRLFESNEGAADEALLANSFALQHYGSAQAAVGKLLHYDGRARTIVGVLPSGFSFPEKTVVWIGSPARPEIPGRTAYNQRAIAKVKPGISPAQLKSEMAALSRQLQTAYPEDRVKALEAVSLQDQIVGSIRPTLRLLMGSVLVVLLIVCANIGHLQLVRSTQMRRDATIRTALGATPAAIARRALLESLLLAVSGCLLALLIAQPALRLLTVMAQADFPRLGDVRLNPDVLLFSFAMSFVTMLVTALLPVWRSVKISPAAVLKQEQGSSSEGRQSRRFRDALIVGEVALTLTLSVASVLLARQLIAESRQDLGFEPDNLLVLDTHADTHATPTQPQEMFGQSPASMHTLRSMLDAVATVPGVKSVAAVAGVPMGPGTADVAFAIHGRSEFKPGAKLPWADIQAITPGYFQTMRIPLLQGRMLADQDNDSSTPVLMISRELAQRVFPGQNPIGQQIMCGYDAKQRWWTIVGVVGDVRQDSPGSPLAQTMYVPVAQHSFRAAEMQVVVRTALDPATMAATLEPILKRDFPMVAVSSTTMREAIGESTRAERFRTMLFACFAAVAILLAAMGMYGVTAYTVAQRRFEFALRLALGAQPGQIVSLTLSHGIAVAGLGILIGVGLSFALLRLLGSQLGKLPVFDPASYAIAILGVLAIAAAAAVIPSRSASQLEPMRVLRGE